MAGQKASKEEKAKIKQLLLEGSSQQEIQQAYPHVDGRVISGMYRRYAPGGPGGVGGVGGAGGVGGFGGGGGKSSAPSVATPAGASSTPPPGTSGGSTAPPPPAISPPAAQAGSETGFTPQAQSPQGIGPGGFRPAFQEYFIVKKMNPPNEGILKTEYPPFTAVELMNGYKPGDYEIHHYKQGRVWNVYRDKVAFQGPVPGTQTPIVDGAVKPPDPAETFVKAADLVGRMHAEGKRDAQESAASANQVSNAREAAKIEADKSATQGLIEVVREQMKPQPRRESSDDKAMDKLLLVMQQDRESQRERHKQDMEEADRRNKAEMERFKEEGAHREKLQSDYFARANELQNTHAERLAKLDQERQQLWKESYEGMKGEVDGMSQAMQQQWNERKAHLDELDKQRREHSLEMEKIRKNSGGEDKDVQVATIIKDGIVGGLDRVGARLDSLAEAGVIGPKVNGKGPVQGGGVNLNQKVQKTNSSGGGESKPAEGKMSTENLIKDAVNSKWFKDLKREIILTVKRRSEVDDPKLKPHGSMQAQQFIDEMNEDPGLRRYVGYLCSRDWETVYADIESSLEVGKDGKSEEKEVLSTEEAGVWWLEFRGFLTISWNQSLGINS